MIRLRPVASTLLFVAACGEPVDSRFSNEDGSGDTVAQCGDLTCESGLRVSFVAQGAGFDPGDYAVLLTVDEEERSCGFRIAGEREECGGEPPCLLSETCGASFNFAILPHTIGMMLGPVPDSVEIRVKRDGDVVLSTSFTPAYQEYAPNGADCGPICRIAQSELSLP